MCKVCQGSEGIKPRGARSKLKGGMGASLAGMDKLCHLHLGEGRLMQAGKSRSGLQRDDMD